MQYFILSVMVLSNTMLNSSDITRCHHEENPLVVELETCIQGGDYVKDLVLYQGPLHNLPVHRIAEIQASCTEYTRAVALAHELHNNERLAEYVGCMVQPVTQEEDEAPVRLSPKNLPAAMQARGRQLLYYAQTSIWPQVQRVQSVIIDLPNNESVEQYVELENERIEAIQGWLEKVRIAVENKQRIVELSTEIKDMYIQQISAYGENKEIA